MGIRGLMTYIRRNRYLLKPHDLHGGYLVIDGHSFASKSYTALGNTFFGGDWRSYSSTIETFFDELEKCNVVPLVIFDGGNKVIDLKKLCVRKESKLEEIMNYTLASKENMTTSPLSIIIVFKSILKKRGVKMVSALSADMSNMAGVAKILDCPVLTFDSAFLVYGVKFIPIDSLESGIVENSWRRGQYVKCCKIFMPENLLKSFRGFSASMFPLLPVLLENKCIQSKFLDKFFSHVQWPDHGRLSHRLYCEEQAKIEATLLWLKGHDLNSAISSIMKNVSRKHQQRILKNIEATIDEYVNLPCDLLEPLGLLQQFEIATGAKLQEKKFEFLGKINDTEDERTWRENETPESDGSSSEEEAEEESKVEVYNHLGELNQEIIDSLPDWFLEYFGMASSSSYFAGLILHRFYDVSMRTEDWKYPSAMTMSLKIVRVIDGLLSAGRKESSIALLLFIRDGMEMVTRSVDTLRGTESMEFPPLRELRDTPMEIRKRILDDTIEISCDESSFEDIPDEWRLYVAVIVYWMRQKDEPLRDSCHMRAVVLTMFLGIVDEKAGSRRAQESSQKRNGKAAEEIEAEDSKISGTTDDSLENALKRIANEDCRAVATFFNISCNIDLKLRTSPAHFNATIAHVFTQFASSLHNAIDLNDLLECPYEQPTIQKLYNGTMMYNIYEKLAKEPNADDYVAATLKDAPSILRVFNLLTNRIETILDRKNDV